MIQNNTVRKGLIVGIILLFAGTTYSPCTANNTVENQSQPESDGNTLYVGGNGPGNYSRIQDAIDNASDKDTIFVFSGAYLENVCINKSINLLGENKDNTIIDANGSGYPVVLVSSDVSIHSFTVQNSGGGSSAGIYIYQNYDNIVISNNKIINNFNGITVKVSSNNSINNNIITKNKNYGIFCVETYTSKIENNEITKNEEAGIWLDTSNQIKITKNNIDRNYFNLVLTYSSHNDISKNNISNSELGIGISLSYSNRIHANNVINNTEDVFFEYGLFWTYIGNRFTRNYWDDYSGIGPKVIVGYHISIATIIIAFLIKDDPESIFMEWHEFDWFPARKPYNLGE